jgi:hypothetical protein
MRNQRLLLVLQQAPVLAAPPLWPLSGSDRSARRCACASGWLANANAERRLDTAATTAMNTVNTVDTIKKALLQAERRPKIRLRLGTSRPRPATAAPACLRDLMVLVLLLVHAMNGYRAHSSPQRSPLTRFLACLGRGGQWHWL